MPPVSRQTKHHTFIDGGSVPRQRAAAEARGEAAQQVAAKTQPVEPSRPLPAEPRTAESVPTELC